MKILVQSAEIYLKLHSPVFRIFFGVFGLIQKSFEFLKILNLFSFRQILHFFENAGKV